MLFQAHFVFLFVLYMSRLTSEACNKATQIIDILFIPLNLILIMQLDYCKANTGFS